MFGKLLGKPISKMLSQQRLKIKTIEALTVDSSLYGIVCMLKKKKRIKFTTSYYIKFKMI